MSCDRELIISALVFVLGLVIFGLAVVGAISLLSGC